MAHAKQHYENITTRGKPSNIIATWKLFIREEVEELASKAKDIEGLQVDHLKLGVGIFQPPWQ